MTPVQAARLIGCSVTHVRRLCRLGVIKHRRIPSLSDPGYIFDISHDEVLRVRNSLPGKGNWGTSHAHVPNHN